MTPPPQTDIVSVAIAITGAFIGAGLAPYVGPYIVIAISAAIGTSCFALPRMQSLSSFAAFRFVVLMTFLACLVTVSVSEAVEHYLHLSTRWSLAPIGLIIGAIGRDWIAVGKWCLSLVGRFFERKVDAGGNK